MRNRIFGSVDARSLTCIEGSPLWRQEAWDTTAEGRLTWVCHHDGFLVCIEVHRIRAKEQECSLKQP